MHISNRLKNIDSQHDKEMYVYYEEIRELINSHHKFSKSEKKMLLHIIHEIEAHAKRGVRDYLEILENTLLTRSIH